MGNWVLFPPLAFTILLIAAFILSYVFSKLSFKHDKVEAGKGKPYACGEDIAAPQISPDYSQFFQFALFFTIMHVVALIIMTLPRGATSAYGIAVVYLLGALVGLLILFRK